MTTRIAFICLLVLSMALRPSAHEVGTTQVAVAFPADGSYMIAISMDAGALLARLEVARHLPRSSPDSAAAFQSRFDELCSDVTAHAAVTFDGVAAAPRAHCAVDAQRSGELSDPSLLGVTVQLRGATPAGARIFRWRFDLTAASYLLSVPALDGAIEQLWLEANGESRALTVNRETPLPSTPAVVWSGVRAGALRVIPHGVDHILFAFGLFLLAGSVRPGCWLVLAYSAAHCVTLVLTLRGVITPPIAIDPIIGASIAMVMLASALGVGRGAWTLPFVAACGLLHGYRISEPLSRLAETAHQPLAAALGFTLGLAGACLAVVMIGFCLVGSYLEKRPAGEVSARA